MKQKKISFILRGW